MLSRNRIIDEPKIYAYLHAVTHSNDILRVSQRIHAKALPILYRSRNLEFCGECFGADYLDTESQRHSIAFLISSLSQYEAHSAVTQHSTIGPSGTGAVSSGAAVPKPIFRSLQSASESTGMTKNHIDTPFRSQISVI